MDPEGFSEKELQPFKDEDGDLEILSFKSCKAEVEQIAELLKTLDVSDYSDTIVLLPAKKAIDYYVTKLKKLGIDCRARAADSSDEICLALLRLVIVQNQPFLHRVLLSHFTSLERKYKSYVLAAYIDGEESFVGTLRQSADNQNWQQRYRDSLSDFAGTSENMTSMNVSSVIDGRKKVKCEQSESIITTLVASDEDLSAKNRVELALFLEEPETEE